MPGKIETQKYKSEIEANPILHTTDCSLVKSEERKTLKTLNLRYTYKERNKLNDEENFVDTPFDIWKKFIFGNQIQFSLCSILKNLPLNSISSITSWPTLLPKRVATGSLKEQEDDEVETVARKEERERERLNTLQPFLLARVPLCICVLQCKLLFLFYLFHSSNRIPAPAASIVSVFVFVWVCVRLAPSFFYSFFFYTNTHADIITRTIAPVHRCYLVHETIRIEVKQGKVWTLAGYKREKKSKRETWVLFLSLLPFLWHFRFHFTHPMAHTVAAN